MLWNCNKHRHTRAHTHTCSHRRTHIRHTYLDAHVDTHFHPSMWSHSSHNEIFATINPLEYTSNSLHQLYIVFIEMGLRLRSHIPGHGVRWILSPVVHGMSKAVGVLGSVPSGPPHVKGCGCAGFCPQWSTTCQRLWVCWIMSPVVHHMSKAVGVLDPVSNRKIPRLLIEKEKDSDRFHKSKSRLSTTYSDLCRCWDSWKTRMRLPWLQGK